jgi:ClpP class serine protease
MQWLLHHDQYASIVDRHDELVSVALKSNAAVAEFFGVTEEAVAAARAEGEATAVRLDVSEGVANISVRGPLLNKPSWVYDLFGIVYSDYQTISAQVEEANASDKVDRVVLDVDSPGGMVLGAWEAADIVHASAKPVHAQVRGMAASAGYLLASQADTIAATSRGDQIGSIGVATERYISNRRVSIASTDAPRKRPDVASPEGVGMVRRELDDQHDLFADAVGRGRGVSRATIDADFGQGGVLLAGEAVRVGMIDSLEGPALGAVAGPACPVVATGASVSAMNKATLRADHPELYAEVVAIGAADERARVLGHIELGEEVDNLSVAAEQIKEGKAVTGTPYYKAQLNQNRIAARGEGTPAPLGAPKPTAGVEDDLEMWTDAARANGTIVDPNGPGGN